MSSQLYGDNVEPQYELGQRRGAARRFADFVQGRPARVLEGSESRAPATREDLLDVSLRLGDIAQLLAELVAVDSGESITVRRRILITAARPFDTFLVEAPDQFHSVKIDNPSAVDVDVVFAGTQPNAGNSDERIPPRTGRILTVPYTEVAIGIDPGVVPAGQTILYCTFYSRPFQPALYPFAP